MDNDTKNARKAIVGVVVCLIILASIGGAMLVVRYFPLRHAGIIEKYSAQYGLDPAFVCAVINAESRFNDNAVSSAGASGLMQIMEDTAYWIAPQAGLTDFSYDQIFDPEVNIRLGCYYLSAYLNRFGSLENALCAYNAGGGRVESWLANPEYSSDGKNLDVIPFTETRDYVERVFTRMRVYEILLKIS